MKNRKGVTMFALYYWERISDPKPATTGTGFEKYISSKLDNVLRVPGGTHLPDFVYCTRDKNMTFLECKNYKSHKGLPEDFEALWCKKQTAQYDAFARNYMPIIVVLNTAKGLFLGRKFAPDSVYSILKTELSS